MGRIPLGDDVVIHDLDEQCVGDVCSLETAKDDPCCMQVDASVDDPCCPPVDPAVNDEQDEKVHDVLRLQFDTCHGNLLVGQEYIVAKLKKARRSPRVGPWKRRRMEETFHKLVEMAPLYDRLLNVIQSLRHHKLGDEVQAVTALGDTIFA